MSSVWAPVRPAAQWLYDRIGNPFELPASLYFAWRHDVPLARWWRNEARQQIRDGLVPLHKSLTPFLDERTIVRLLDEHQAGRANHAQRLWNLWVLNEWARMFLAD